MILFLSRVHRFPSPVVPLSGHLFTIGNFRRKCQPVPVHQIIARSSVLSAQRSTPLELPKEKLGIWKTSSPILHVRVASHVALRT